jgi:hypothetical protein
VIQVVAHDYSALDVSKFLGTSNKNLYDWLKNSANLSTSVKKKAIFEQR